MQSNKDISDIYKSEADNQALASKLNEIHTSRDILQHFYMQTKLIERLKENMEAIFLLDDKKAKLPKQMFLLLKNLGQHIEKQTQQKLQQQFEQLSLVLKKGLNEINHIVITLKQSEQTQDINVEKYQTIISEYTRRARTAIAMKFALKEKNIEVNSQLRETINSEIIEKNIHYLRIKENQLKSRMIFEAKSLQNKIKKITTVDSCPGDLTQHLNKIEHELKETINTLENNLPIELLELNHQQAEDAALHNFINGLTKQTQQTQLKKQKRPRKKTGFWNKFIIWLNTPWSKSWKSLDK